MGCLEPGCGEVPILNPPAAGALFSIYPNPVTSNATVEIHIPDNFNIIPGTKLSLDIYDITGKRADRYANIPVHNSNEVIRFNLFKRNLAAGVYTANLRYAEENMGTVKIIFE